MKTGIFLFAVLAVVVTSQYNIADEVQKRMAEPPAQTMTYEVQEGDTVWDIAGRHSDNRTDVRSVVYAIESDNHIQNGALTPGQKIIIRK